VKRLVKTILCAAAPKWTAAKMSARARAHSQRLLASWGNPEVARKLLGRYGNAVQSGPFAGLTLTAMTQAEQIGPYLLGVYESELDEAWATVFRGSYNEIIDIGAKFGYYAIGLARRYPTAAVVAFDTDWWARKALREMAAANGTRHIDVQAFCDPDWLARNTQEAALIVSDCEGYEAVLFGPGTIPKLQSATLIIESHDELAAGVTDRLRMAFEETHFVKIYNTDGSRREPASPLEFLTEPERQLAIQEVRPPQSWLLCLPKIGPNKQLYETSVGSSVSEPDDFPLLQRLSGARLASR
jgi:hypothetical protein